MSLNLLDRRTPKTTTPDILAPRASRSMKDAVIEGWETINDIYSKLIFNSEKHQGANLKVIAPEKKEGPNTAKRLVHHHSRAPNTDDWS